MNQGSHNSANIVLLRGAALWLLMALLLAWCLVGLVLGVPFLKAIFVGKQTRLLQAHIDFLLMTALIYPVHVSTRKSFGLMTRKLSVTESRKLLQFLGTLSRKKSSVASANCPHVA